MQKALILGATSGIAQAVIERLARQGVALTLVARNPERLETVASHARILGAESVTSHTVDFLDDTASDALLHRAWEEQGGFDLTLIAHGTLPDQQRCEADPAYARLHFESNATSTLQLLQVLSNLYTERRSGTIAVISSVAGERGRGSLYLYGAAKAAVTHFCAGLRNRLHAHGVHVLTILPGPVDTPMTAHLPKSPLFVSPAYAAARICRAIQKRKNVVYVPGIWWLLMSVIHAIPEALFKRLKL